MIERIKVKMDGNMSRLEEVIDKVLPPIELRQVEAQRVEKKSPIPDSEYLTIRQVGALLHVSRSTIWRYSKLGILKPRRLGSRILYARADIDNYLMKEEGHGER